MPAGDRTDLAQRPLTARDLLPGGPLVRIGRFVRVFESIDSTNGYLREHAATAGDGAVASAELQTGGRGRLGRRWESPRGASLLVSVLLVEPERSALFELGGLLGALAACEAIEQATDVSCAVRWPNDVVVSGRKLGGVLAESFVIADGAAVAARRLGLVIGIGLNCLQHRGHFSGELTAKATSLELESAHVVDRAAVAAALLARLDEQSVSAGADGGRRLRAAWRERCLDFGSRAVLEHDGRCYEGTMLDIDDAGNLILQLDQGGRRCFAAATTTRNW